MAVKKITNTHNTITTPKTTKTAATVAQSITLKLNGAEFKEFRAVIDEDTIDIANKVGDIVLLELKLERDVTICAAQIVKLNMFNKNVLSYDVEFEKEGTLYHVLSATKNQRLRKRVELEGTVILPQGIQDLLFANNVHKMD